MSKKLFIGTTLSLLTLLTLGSCSKNSDSGSPTPTNQVESSVNWYAGVGQFNGSLDFGDLTTSQTKILSATVKNVGDATLIGPVTLSGNDFNLVYQNCETLLVGQTCMVKVAFSAANKANGPYVAALHLGDQEAA